VPLLQEAAVGPSRVAKSRASGLQATLLYEEDTQLLTTVKADIAKGREPRIAAGAHEDGKIVPWVV